MYADGVGVCWQEGPIACCCLLRPDELPQVRPESTFEMAQIVQEKAKGIVREKDIGVLDGRQVAAVGLVVRWAQQGRMNGRRRRRQGCVGRIHGRRRRSGGRRCCCL